MGLDAWVQLNTGDVAYWRSNYALHRWARRRRLPDSVPRTPFVGALDVLLGGRDAWNLARSKHLAGPEHAAARRAIRWAVRSGDAVWYRATW